MAKIEPSATQKKLIKRIKNQLSPVNEIKPKGKKSISFVYDEVSYSAKYNDYLNRDTAKWMIYLTVDTSPKNRKFKGLHHLAQTMKKVNAVGVDGVKEITKHIKKTADKLPNKKLTLEGTVVPVALTIIKNLKKKIPEAKILKISDYGVRIRYKDKIFGVAKFYGDKTYYVSHTEKMPNDEMRKLTDEIKDFLTGPTRQDAIRRSKKIRKEAIKLPKKTLKLEGSMKNINEAFVIDVAKILPLLSMIMAQGYTDKLFETFVKKMLTIKDDATRKTMIKKFIDIFEKPPLLHDPKNERAKKAGERFKEKGSFKPFDSTAAKKVAGKIFKETVTPILEKAIAKEGRSKNATSLLRKSSILFDRFEDIMSEIGLNVKEVKAKTKEIKKNATKLPKKTLKLEGTEMKYNNLLELLKKAIIYKRGRKMVEDIYKRISEEEKIVIPRRHDAVSVQDKRKKLKDLYKRMLKATPYANNIPAFMELIDQADESYIDYELKINFNDAFKVVNELINGKGDLTPEEMGELANIVSGVGIPAIEKHATGKHKMSKKDAKFGAEGLSKSAERFNKSVEARRNPKYKLEAPKSKALVSTEQSKDLAPRQALQKMFTQIDIPKDSEFWKAASKLKSKGINVDRLAKSMTKASKYSEAKKQAEMELKKQGKSIEDLRGTDDIFNIWNQIKKQKVREKVRVRR
jgi:hypothetical protein